MQMKTQATSRPTHNPKTVDGWTLAFGQIRHLRLTPVQHGFSYRGFFVSGPAEDLSNAGQGSWLFGINRTALLSVHGKDHGTGQDPMTWLHQLLAQAGITNVARIRFEGFPRVLGYAFKPVSFWYCEGADGDTRAIITEVNNTFGERHTYLLADPSGHTIAPGQILTAQKQFHVSPFFPVTGGYRFRFHQRSAQTGSLRRSVARIEHFDESGLLLTTSISGEHQPVCARSVMRALLAYPLFTLGVVVRIHWHALRLTLKRVPFFRKPEPPSSEVTAGHPISSDLS